MEGGDKTGLWPVTRYELSQISTVVSSEISGQKFPEFYRNLSENLLKNFFSLSFTLYVTL